MLLQYLLVALAAHAVYGEIRASVRRNKSGGLIITIPDHSYRLVGLHYSINKKLKGVAAAQWNYDIRRKQGNKWVHKNHVVDLKPGDKVNYWVYVVKDGLGFHITDQSWTCCEGESPDAQRDPSGCTTYPCLVFEDNFDTFDFDVWEHEITAGGGGNWEFQYYTNNRTNSYVKDGKLFIKPTLTSDKYGEDFLTSGTLDLWGSAANDVCTGNSFFGCQRQGTPEHIINPIQSARLRSIRGFSMKYGKLEVEAKMPTGDWLWPAIWLLPKWNTYGGWPASGEIDICESRGNRNLTNGWGASIGVNSMGSTLHFGPDYMHNGWMNAHAEKVLSSGTFGDSFHKYVLEWDEGALKVSVDDEHLLTVLPDNEGFWKLGKFETTNMENPWRNSKSKMAPFDQEFYVILNVAVGGTNGFFPDDIGGKPWHNSAGTASRDFWNARENWYPTWNADINDGEDAAMQINYIRYWKTKP